MRRLHVSVLISGMAACAALSSGAVFAQEAASAYPSKPVTWIVPAAPGGPTDPETRMYSTKLSEMLGQQFVVDYKGGAGTTIGTAYVAKSPADGYTLLVVGTAFTVFPALYKNLTFDTIKDFAPVTQMSQSTTVLLVSPSLPAKTVAEYIALAKASPGKLNFGTTGAGGAGHLSGAWLHNLTNTTVTFVHYKGTGPLMPDLVSGRLDATAQQLPLALPLIKTGKLRALGIMNDKRSKLLPELPTLVEQGIPDYNYANSLGFVAPAATPAAIVNKLAEGFAKIARMPDVVATLEAQGGIAVGNTPAQFRQIIVNETARWRKVVQDNGIKLEE